jgi:hypothetical protein
LEAGSWCKRDWAGRDSTVGYLRCGDDSSYCRDMVLAARSDEDCRVL